jgi:hypothetical protein
MFKQNKPQNHQKHLHVKTPADKSTGPIANNLFAAIQDMQDVKNKLALISDNSAQITDILNKLSIYDQALDLQSKITEEHSKAIDEQNTKIELLNHQKAPELPVMGMVSSFSLRTEDFKGWFLCDGRVISDKYWGVVQNAKFSDIWTTLYGEKKLPDLRSQKLTNSNWFIYIGVI